MAARFAKLLFLFSGIACGFVEGALGQASSPNPTASQPIPAHSSLVMAYRTPRHISYSSPDIFHGVADTVLQFLTENNVAIARDPERNTIETAELFSTDSMVRLARDAGASELLYVAVDRPITKWIKVTVQCYDLSGKQLWNEEASNTSAMTGKVGLQKTTDQLRHKLQSHLGQPCLVGPTASVASTPHP
jgi:hypothetical protein